MCACACACIIVPDHEEIIYFSNYKTRRCSVSFFGVGYVCGVGGGGVLACTLPCSAAKMTSGQIYTIFLQETHYCIGFMSLKQK